jgi:hypothetical protein
MTQHGGDIIYTAAALTAWPSPNGATILELAGSDWETPRRALIRSADGLIEI